MIQKPARTWRSLRRLLVLLLLATAVPTAAWAQAQAPRWQIGLSPSLLRGSYGTGTRTDIWYTPLIARRLFGDGDLTVIVPYACIRGSGNITVVGGSPVRTDGTGPAAPLRGEPSAPVRGQEPSASTPSRDVAEDTGTTCGLGDIVVRGRLYVVDERGWLPTVAVRGHFKTPTASTARGLGTGRPDEGLGVEVSRRVGGGVLLMVDGGYTWIGKPDGASYRDRWWYDVGVSRNLVRNVADLSLFFEDYRAIVPGLPSARDLLAVLSLRGSGGWRLQLAGQFGLSDGAPDHGLTIGASRRF